MEIKLEYQGKTYYRNNTKWVDRDFMVVPLYLQHILNTLWHDEEAATAMSYEEAKAEGDRLKQSESYTLAIKYYELSLKQVENEAQISVVLPRITSCYRKINRPRKVIELFSEVKAAWGEGIINEAMLTSVAAAYCDLDEPENAIRCCRWAYRVLMGSKGEYSPELANVFARANKMIDPSYSQKEAFEEY